MTVEEFEVFSARLVELGELFEAKLTASKQVLYFQALQDLPLVQVERALVLSARSCTFMPKPAEIRTLAVGNQEDQTELAWMQFQLALRHAGGYSSLALQDAALAETIVALFGSWPEACALELSPEMWSSKRKEFGRVYRVMRDRGVNGPRYLAGICEQHNSRQLDWTKYTPVALLTEAGVRTLSGTEADTYRAQIAGQAFGFKRLDSAAVLPPVKDESA